MSGIIIWSAVKDWELMNSKCSIVYLWFESEIDLFKAVQKSKAKVYLLRERVAHHS